MTDNGDEQRMKFKELLEEHRAKKAKITICSLGKFFTGYVEEVQDDFIKFIGLYSSNVLRNMPTSLFGMRKEVRRKKWREINIEQFREFTIPISSISSIKDAEFPNVI